MLFTAIFLSVAASVVKPNVLPLDQAPLRLEFQKGRYSSTGRLQYHCYVGINCPFKITCNRDKGKLTESTNWECVSDTEKLTGHSVKFELSNDGKSFVNDSFYIRNSSLNKPITAYSDDTAYGDDTAYIDDTAYRSLLFCIVTFIMINFTFTKLNFHNFSLPGSFVDFFFAFGEFKAMNGYEEEYLAWNVNELLDGIIGE